jgi:SAM-dependent methyltransferase
MEGRTITKYRSFYEQWYRNRKAEESFSFMKEVKASFLRKRLLRLFARYFLFFYSIRDVCFRDFFEDNMAPHSTILDLGCGEGRSYFSEYGNVVGLDMAIGPLRNAIKKYETAIRGAVEFLPFRDFTFDFVVSSDLLGHVPDKNKNKVLDEIRRVLKTNGNTAHVVETESKDFCFRLAREQPELFNRYFIEQIGGHFGLERPSQVIHRFQTARFVSVNVEKLWGPFWRSQAYVNHFDNEYKERSLSLKAWVFFCRLCIVTRIPWVLLDTFLGFLSILQVKLTQVDSSQLLFLDARR